MWLVNKKKMVSLSGLKKGTVYCISTIWPSPKGVCILHKI